MVDRYAAMAQDYWANGWKSVLPLPPGSKVPPPKGYTGYGALIPSFPDIMAWTEDYPEGNLALRMPETVVGIDVDAYDARTGAATFTEAIRRWGPLPPTVRSTSREDGISGIRLYRVPAGTELEAQITFPEMNIGHIEICQFFHRYVVSYPSTHPNAGRVYQWLDDDGNRMPGSDPTRSGIPNIEDLPDLPQGWIDGLRKSSQTDITTHADPFSVLKGLQPGPMSKAVKDALLAAFRHLNSDPGSRHDNCMKDVLLLWRLGEQGEPGVAAALRALGQAFAAATVDRNTEREAAEEYSRMVFGQRGHDLIASTPSRENVDRTLGIQPQAAPPPGPAAAHSAAVEQAPDEADVAALLRDELGAEEMTDEDADALLMGVGVTTTPPPPEQPREYVPEEPKSFAQRILSIAEIGNMKPAEPVIDKLLYENTLAQLSAEPGSFKTFFVLAMMCAIASEKSEWLGYKVNRQRRVLYIAAEGANGMHTRVLAWCQSENVSADDLSLDFYPEAVQVDDWTQMQELQAVIDERGYEVIVFDTRARCTVGMEENSATEQGKAIQAVEKLRYETGCTALVIHHSARAGASATAAGRGSNAWDGAVWTDLRSKRKGMNLVITCAKHKDVESGCTHEFSLLPVVVPHRGTTLVVGKPGEFVLEKRSVNMAELIEITSGIVALAPTEGMLESAIVNASGLNKTAVMRLRKSALELGMWKNVSTGKISRYVVNPDWVAPEGDQE